MRYTKGSAVYNGRDIVVGGVRIVNPTEEQLMAAGYVAEEVTEVEPDQSGMALAELAAGDYKIIKCMEAYLTGEAMPYDIAALHTERDRLRAIVNSVG